MTPSNIAAQLDKARRKSGFLTIAETLELTARGNTIYDPYSTLIARKAEIGTGNVFYPNTRLEMQGRARITICDDNVLSSGTVICSNQGPITIGNQNMLGDGCILITTHRKQATITVGSNTRLRGFIEIDGKSSLGDGSQMLGHISAIDLRLAAGQPHTHSIADERAAVLKGNGRAQGISLAIGEVIAGDGSFVATDVRMQSYYHPVPETQEQ
jgi:acetyltransferase-like isoleucine patch superfamily enzyme